MTPTIEASIDDLYRVSLSEFIAKRTSLAKTLTGADAQRVKKLVKPTVVPWTINQVYWRARPAWDRVIDSGKQLRLAQVATLEGRKADVKGAAETHHKAIADAVDKAGRIAAADNLHPSVDALTQTLEALSLTGTGDEPRGRLTKPLQPAGFEALAGIKVAPKTVKKLEVQQARAKEEAALDKKAEASRKKHEAVVRKAEAELERARRKMEEAAAALKTARDRK
ncbi:MAG TPA: hypothetical protein VH583_08630 [Vicinamibacterales bacterium]|jgi:hypothetical protein